MKLIATKPLLYAGVSLNVGDEFEASEKDAKLLKAIRKAEDAPVAVVTADAPIYEPAPDGKPRRGRPKKVETAEDDEGADE